MTWHHLLYSHTFMSKDDARIVLCQARWRRTATVWFKPHPDALWEVIGDLDELLARL